MLRLAHFIIALCLANPALAADPRQLQGPKSPSWLHAVGRLSIPGYRYVDGDKQHYTEHCSATLVTPDIILSAWHCMEYYRDLSQVIVFALAGRKLEARLLSDGGTMDADWVLLRLSQPLGSEVLTSAFPDPTELPGSSVTMAGFSADPGLGRSGEVLSYHSNCRVLSYERNRLQSNCLAFKGASGGPVVQYNRIIGVISAGDSQSQSFFIASRSFAHALRPYLNPSVSAAHLPTGK